MRRQIFDGRERTFSFKNPEGTYRLPLSGISYFYSDKRKVNVVCAGQEGRLTHTFYGKLDEVEEQLFGVFVRVHQRYLVNPGRVTRIGGESVTMDGEDIPMSRAMKEEAVVKLAKAMLEGDKG